MSKEVFKALLQDRVQELAESVVEVLRAVPGQDSTASRGRRFVGQVLLAPDAAGRDGFIESSSAQAELNSGGDFRFSASCCGRFVAGDHVWFSARQLPTGWWEAFDLIESSAEAEFGHAASGGFRVSVSFSVRKSPSGFMEAL